MELTYLHDQGILWRSSEDFRDKRVYHYYPDGKESYRLFGFNYQIRSLAQLQYHLVVIRVLNEDIEYQKFYDVCRYIQQHSKVGMSEDKLKEVVDNCYYPSETPEPEIRKFFFNPKYKLSQSERMKIISGITQRPSITEEDIYDAIGHLKQSGVKITFSRIATYLDVSRPTLYKHMTELLRHMVEESNKQ